MPTKIFVGLIAGVLFLGLCYLEEHETSVPLSAEYAQGPEALKWLRASDNESALASNRFGETRDAIRFVQQLYSAGASRVTVPLASIRKDDVETYADSLVVTLPSDPGKRQRVWKLCASELKREGGKPGDSSDEDQVLLWWD